MPDQDRFAKKYGPWALVTGASSGIGEHIAQELAAKGVNIVLAARRIDRLQNLVTKIQNEHDVDARAVAVDLTSNDGVETLRKVAEDLEVGLLVNNAGREDSGRFLETSANEALSTIDLNVKLPMLLTHHFAQKMKARGRGGVIFLSSVVAFQGVPHIANYAATKAYDLIFAESLAAEFADSNIDILAVAPGFTQTELSPDFDFTGLPIKPLAPSRVAKRAIESLGGKRLIVPGAINQFLYLSGKYLQPRRMNTFAFGRVFGAVLRKKLNAETATGRAVGAASQPL